MLKKIANIAYLLIGKLGISFRNTYSGVTPKFYLEEESMKKFANNSGSVNPQVLESGSC